MPGRQHAPHQALAGALRRRDLLGLGLLLLSACGGDEPTASAVDTDPFPLAVGDRWDYAGGDLRFPALPVTHEVAALDVQGVAHFVVQIPALENRVVAVYRSTSEGLLRWNSADGLLPDLRQAPELFLRLPLSVGLSWSIVNVVNQPLESNPDALVTREGASRVVGIESVTTPAGTFGNAFVVTRTDKLSIFQTSLQQTTLSTQSTTTDWLVPGVGRVRTSFLFETSQCCPGFRASSSELTAYRLAARR